MLDWSQARIDSYAATSEQHQLGVNTIPDHGFMRAALDRSKSSNSIGMLIISKLHAHLQQHYTLGQLKPS